jgi:transposase
MLEFEEESAAGGGVERAVGERNGAAGGVPVGVPDPELVERPSRRRFTAGYKLRVLGEADRCSRPGEVGALLRREGLYSSILSEWRKQREAGALQALERPRGRKRADRREAEIAGLRRRLERTEAELAKARKVTWVQGEVSALLGELLGTEGASGRGSTER